MNESEQGFKVIFDYANDGMLITDIKTEKIYTANKTLCQMLGYSLDEIKNLTNEDIYPETDLTNVLDRLEKVSKGSIETAREIPVKKKDGSIFYADVKCSIPVILEGRTCVICIFRDITEHKKIDQLKDEFISTVSHELRSPLSIIKEGVSILIDEIPGKLNDSQAKILKAAKRNIDRLARIINKLLDMSKIESGSMKIEKELFDIAILMKEVGASFEADMKKKGLGLKMDFPPEGVNVRADPDAMTQVINNLIDNAIKFTKEGYIKISARESEGAVECSVYDTGIGISKENVPKLFSKFQQFGRATGPGEKGTGLGLSIAKGIVDLHSGKIGLESEPGKGTKAIFILPK